ncbi:hypothetical protein [Intestinibacter sp.]
MNWNNIWNTLFNKTELFGINMGFWVSLAIILIVVVAMNITFWSMKPLKNVE